MEKKDKHFYFGYWLAGLAMVGMLSMIIIVIWGTYSISIDSSNNKPIVEKYPVITIDGCEYIEVDKGGSAYSITHKGNCSNPKHYFKSNNQYKYVVDLPEEYPLISTNPLQRDSLSGYVSRDTLYIQFLKNKKR